MVFVTSHLLSCRLIESSEVLVSNIRNLPTMFISLFFNIVGSNLLNSCVLHMNTYMNIYIYEM